MTDDDRPTAHRITGAVDIARTLGCKTRPDANGNYQCRCPGPLHRNGDRAPSLSVKDGRNGRLLLFCFAGCDYRDIAAALERHGISLRPRT
jgi:putative DNA primase/helicase